MAIVSSTQQPASNEDYYNPVKSWAVVLSAALFFFYEFIQMNMFNAIDPSLVKVFSVTATQLGNLSAMYFYGNIIFLIPAGILLDRFSTRRLLLTAISVSVVCTYLFAFSSSLGLAEFYRLITGLASTFCMLSAVRLASRWFPSHRIALVLGMVVTMAMAGGMLAQTPLTFMVHKFGWRHAVMMNATLGLVFIFIIYKVVFDYPKSEQQTHDQETHSLGEIGILTSLVIALKNPQNWLAGIYTNFLSFPVIILGAAWGSLYLIHVRHLTHIETTNVTQMIFLGMILGSPAMGWLSDKFKRRKAPMVLGAFLCTLIILTIMKLPYASLGELMLLFFLLGFISGTQVITYPLVVESNPRAITTTAEGLACMLIMSAGLFQVVFGWLLDLSWKGTSLNGIRIYGVHAYSVAIWLLPIAFILALIVSVFLKETRCEQLSNESL